MSDQTTAGAVGVTMVGSYSILKFDGALEYLAWGVLITLAGWVVYKVAQWWAEASEPEEKKPTAKELEDQAKARKKAKAKAAEPPDPEEE